MRVPVADLIDATEGRFVPASGSDPQSAVVGVGIDSRAIGSGELFVAIRAERDGHEYVAAAAAAGATVALVERRVDVEIDQIIVSDTVAALGRLGGLARDRTAGTVIGITGSVGKTTTKDLLASICAVAGPYTASEKSLNNEMGVPLTLLNGRDDAVRTVIEMGARGSNHIAMLCAIARPEIGVVTTVAAAHTEMFGSIEQIAVAKGELVEAVPPSGVAVLNADVELVAAMASRCQGRVLTFGSGGELRASGVELDEDLHPSFVLETPWGSTEVRLAVRGSHNVANALAAAAAALSTGVDLAGVAAGLSAADLSPSRMALHRLASGAVLLDDSYNANPASMRAGLAALADLGADRRIAVLGLMAELGGDTEAEHRAIADLAADLDIELVAVGTSSYGVEPIADVETAMSSLRQPGPGDAVLVKGSRVAQLDRLARAWTSGDLHSR